jgi:hypothetical protein
MSKALLAFVMLLLTQRSTSFQIRATNLPAARDAINAQSKFIQAPMLIMNGKGSLLAKQSDNDEETNDSSKILGVLKKNPGTIIVVPFVALFGLDLIANIAVVTKRSLEGEQLYF